MTAGTVVAVDSTISASEGWIRLSTKPIPSAPRPRRDSPSRSPMLHPPRKILVPSLAKSRVVGSDGPWGSSRFRRCRRVRIPPRGGDRRGRDVYRGPTCDSCPSRLLAASVTTRINRSSHTIGACRFRYSLQIEFAAIIKVKGLADAKLTNRHRNDDVTFGGGSTKAGGELDGCTEQIIVVVCDRFSGADSDAYVKWRFGSLVALMESSLHLNRERDQRRPPRSKEAMMPSPVCLTSRPSRAASSPRTMSLCSLSRWIWPSSPSWRSEQPTRRHR